MISGTVSKLGNTNAQVYGTHFGWTRLFQMKLKSDTYDTFPLLFKCYGFPPEMIMDNSKEQLSSNFCKKLCEANYHQKMIEPHSDWSKAAEMKTR